LEKPIASDLEGARDVLSAWCESGSVGVIGLNYRFNPLYLREIRRAGRLRQLTSGGLPILLLGLTAHGSGEILGFCSSDGDANEKAIDIEVRHERYISRRDLLELANP
jgi:hypothetical protein